MIRRVRKPIVPLVLFALAVSFFLSLPLAEAVEKFPKPIGAVNDFANLISPEYRQEMKALAHEVFEKTGTSVVVVTLQTVGDDDPRNYANSLYKAWGIGRKGEDKGVLIFLALKERRIRIETGYGVEGILPDGLVGEILDRDVTPYLKKGDYGRGLLNAMVSVSGVIAKDAKASLSEQPQTSGDMKPAASRKSRGVPWTSNVTSLLVLILIVFLLLGTKRGRDILPFILLMLLSGSGRGGGGGFDGFGGGGFGGFGGGSSGGGGADRGF
jgi:uncharacterized protein